jgi:hypothetical protein
VVCKGGRACSSEGHGGGRIWREGGRSGSDVARGVNSSEESEGAGSKYVRGGGVQCVYGWATLGGGSSFGSGAIEPFCQEGAVALSYMGRFMGGGGVVETEEEQEWLKLSVRLSGGIQGNGSSRILP